MGTLEFAVASLEALQKRLQFGGCLPPMINPAGRGMEMQQSAVKKFAGANNLKVLQPEKLRNPDFWKN